MQRYAPPPPAAAPAHIRALLLDRDGVVIAERGDYNFARAHMVLVPGAAHAIASANRAGVPVALITNQGGVAKGLYTHQEVDTFHGWLAEELANEGAHLDLTLFCPHHPDLGHCLCRKPLPLMVQRALRLLGADPRQSLMIGDTPRDIQAANVAGVMDARQIEPNSNWLPMAVAWLAHNH